LLQDSSDISFSCRTPSNSYSSHVAHYVGPERKFRSSFAVAGVRESHEARYERDSETEIHVIRNFDRRIARVRGR